MIYYLLRIMILTLIFSFYKTLIIIFKSKILFENSNMEKSLLFSKYFSYIFFIIIQNIQ